MELLDGFDFNSTANDPGIFGYQELYPTHPQLLLDLEEATEQDNLPAVKEAFEALRRTHARPAVLSRPGSALVIAVELEHEDIVRYLLCQGVQISSHYVRIATCRRSKALIQLFLDNGWPVNEPLGWSDPPALA